MEVVILAAGSGRRFGGVKQFVPVAPDGATLLEVTLGDARRAGCDRAVIVTAASDFGVSATSFDSSAISWVFIVNTLKCE